MKRAIIVGLVVLLVVMNTAIIIGSIKEDTEKTRYSPHGVIRINGDSDFTPANGVTGGDGSANNPYIISGWDIDAHGAGNAIYIGNTTAYFIVENCRLHNASGGSYPYFMGAGITLFKAPNGIIRNNEIFNTVYGMYIWHSDSNIITKNTITNSSQGIQLDWSNYNAISNNTITNTGEGIYLYDFSSNNRVLNNTVRDNSNKGIALDYARTNTISGNIVSNNTKIGIYVFHSDGNTIENNTANSNGQYGIQIIYSSSVTVSYNTISSNGEYGIYLDANSSGNLIYHNSLYYNHGSGGTYDPTHVQAYDDGTNNSWNTTGGIGNYWYDWAENNDTNDNNGDGIVDWPYHIDGSANAMDHYPIKATPPPAPLNLRVHEGAGYANLTWDGPLRATAPITEYHIYRNGTQIATVPADQLWYNDTSVTGGVTYTYYVTSYNPAGESTPSNEVKATPGSAVPELSVAIVAAIGIVAVVAMRRA